MIPFVCFLLAAAAALWAAFTGRSLVAAAVGLVALGLAVGTWPY